MADILYRFNNLYKSGDASNVKMFPFFDSDSVLELYSGRVFSVFSH